MTEGIVIPAFGRQGYAFAAYNLLKSIKYHNDRIKVYAVMDDHCKYALPESELKEFDAIITIPIADTVDVNGSIDPSRVKLGIYKLLPFENNLVIDADNVCLKDMQPLLDYYKTKGGYFYIQDVHGGKRADAIDYMWVKNEDAWDFFGLAPEQELRTIQTSSMWIVKTPEAESLFAEFQEWFAKGFPRKKLIGTWGRTIPDELIMSGVLARKGMNADGGIKVDFLGHKISETDLAVIESKHYLLSLYGSNKPNKELTKAYYKEWADRLMDKIMNAFQKAHRYKMHFIFRDKHANFI